MKHLVVLAHPKDRSFTRDVADEYCQAAATMGHECRVRDLYRMKFNPVASADDLTCMKIGNIPDDIAEEQAHLLWADVIVFCHPIWWIGLPAIVKGYVDRVFAIGFAYGHSPKGVVGLLASKKAIILTSSGSTQEEFDTSGKMQSILVAQDLGTIRFCGIDLLDHLHFAPVGSRSTPAMIAGYHAQVRETVRRHFAHVAA